MWYYSQHLVGKCRLAFVLAQAHPPLPSDTRKEPSMSAAIDRFVKRNRRSSVPQSALLIVCILSAATSVRAELTWTGSVSDRWNTYEENWRDESGEAVAFSSGSDVRFTDAAQCTTVFVDESMSVGSLSVDTEAAYVFTNSGNHALSSVSRIRKTGSGAVSFCGQQLVLGDIGEGLFVENGTANLHGQTLLEKYAKKENGVLFVGTNAVLNLATRNLFGNDQTKAVASTIKATGGTVRFSDAIGHLKIGNLILDDGKFLFGDSTGYNEWLGVVSLSGKVAFHGQRPYTWLQDGFLQDSKPTYKKFQLWSSPRTVFDVPDLTGDAAEDVVLGVWLADHCTNAYAKTLLKGGFVKTGSGTLALTSPSSTFSGDIEVREGVLQVGPNSNVNAASQAADLKSHWVGSLTNSDRRIVVKEGATLYLPNRNCFGTQAGITNAGVGLTLAFDGGVFSNHHGQGFLLPNLEFSNGGRIAPGRGADNYGRFMVKERFAVRGSRAFEWMPSSDATDDPKVMSAEALSLNGIPENVFDVDDVTGDADPDATFGVPFMIGFGFLRADTATGAHALDDWLFGFRKTGQGTMRITAGLHQVRNGGTPSGFASHSFNGDVKVEGGTLQIDGDISTSRAVIVSQGAMLSGTGFVNGVSIADGGGFRVANRQGGVLRIAGDLNVGKDAVVDVVVPQGASFRDIKANVATVAGNIVGVENLSGATVVADGTAIPNAMVAVKGKTISVRYAFGTTIVVR